MPREYTADFLQKNATKIGFVNRRTCYGHPLYGDEIGMLMVDCNGAVYQTAEYDLPEPDDDVYTL